MGFLDKLLGRTKKAGGDVMDKPSLHEEGAAQETEAVAEEAAEKHEEAASEARKPAATAKTRRKKSS